MSDDKSEEAGVKQTDTQLKNKIRSIKNFQDDELPYELFLTTRQKTKIKNAFANNMSTDIKCRKSQLAKIIQSGEFTGKTLGNLSRKVLLDLALPLVNPLSTISSWRFILTNFLLFFQSNMKINNDFIFRFPKNFSVFLEISGTWVSLWYSTVIFHLYVLHFVV